MSDKRMTIVVVLLALVLAVICPPYGLVLFYWVYIGGILLFFAYIYEELSEKRRIKPAIWLFMLVLVALGVSYIVLGQGH